METSSGNKSNQNRFVGPDYQFRFCRAKWVLLLSSYLYLNLVPQKASNK